MKKGKLQTHKIVFWIILFIWILPTIIFFISNIYWTQRSQEDGFRTIKTHLVFSLVQYNIFKYRFIEGKFPDDIKQLDKKGFIDPASFREIENMDYITTEYEKDDKDSFRLKCSMRGLDRNFQIETDKELLPVYKIIASQIYRNDNVVYVMLTKRSNEKLTCSIGLKDENKQPDKDSPKYKELVDTLKKESKYDVEIHFYKYMKLEEFKRRIWLCQIMNGLKQ